MLHKTPQKQANTSDSPPNDLQAGKKLSKKLTERNTSPQSHSEQPSKASRGRQESPKQAKAHHNQEHLKASRQMFKAHCKVTESKSNEPAATEAPPTKRHKTAPARLSPKPKKLISALSSPEATTTDGGTLGRATTCLYQVICLYIGDSRIQRQNASAFLVAFPRPSL